MKADIAMAPLIRGTQKIYWGANPARRKIGQYGMEESYE